MEKSISAVIHTHNEESNIADCIKSIKPLTTNIIVIDMESTDNTVFTAKSSGAEVCTFPFYHYVEPARTYGINQANTNWVLIIDADERLTSELILEIRRVINDDKFSYYKIPRKNLFNKVHWLKHGDWYPDYQIRLINKHCFTSWPKEIHSTPVIRGNFSCLKKPLIHYFHGDIANMVEKTVNFENIESQLLFKAKRKANTIIFFRKFLGELWRRLIKKVGFLDGDIGIIECIYQAFSKTITYLYLYEKQKNYSL